MEQDKKLLKTVEKQLSLILLIAQEQDKKDKAVRAQDFETALYHRNEERRLLKEQIPFIDLLNMVIKNLKLKLAK